MRTAYCDCFSGISGDMFLGAVLDAGLPLDYLKSELERLDLPEPFELRVQTTQKGALRATSFQVILPESTHLHTRHFSDIAEMIHASELSQRVKTNSLTIFQILAEAEARVHGMEIEKVHFHEVGAIDSIVDIVGATIGLEYLEVERLYASALPLGSGQIHTQHGLLPLPAPATLEILSRVHAPTVPTQANVELVTPTGAAILAALATFEMPDLVLAGVGVGAGRRDLPWPNVLRLILSDPQEPPAGGMVLIETNIDDMNPQIFGYVMQKLFAGGALDVYLTPIYMKKNRPGTQLSVICRRSEEATLVAFLLQETSTLGMRVQPIARYEAQRAFQPVQTEYGEVIVKLKILAGRVVQANPEYDVCASLAQASGVPLMSVYQAALGAGQELLGRPVQQR